MATYKTKQVEFAMQRVKQACIATPRNHLDIAQAASDALLAGASRRKVDALIAKLTEDDRETVAEGDWGYYRTPYYAADHSEPLDLRVGQEFGLFGPADDGYDREE